MLMCTNIEIYYHQYWYIAGVQSYVSVYCISGV